MMLAVPVPCSRHFVALLVATATILCLVPATALAELSTARLAVAPLKVEKLARLDVAQLNKILNLETPAFIGATFAYSPATNAVNLYKVTYASVVPEQKNRPIIATGLVAVPETTGKEAGKALPMVAYHHGTVMLKTDVPSNIQGPLDQGRSSETRLMVAQFAGQGYVVIAPDYFGMGGSLEREGYMVVSSHQQACTDLYHAALFLLNQQSIAVTNLFLTGWSQGGVVTMAWLEQLEQSGVPVKAVGTAAAQCDAWVMLNGYLHFPRVGIDAPWTTVMIILTAFSYEHYYGIPGLTQALFNPDQYDIARRIYMREPYKPEDMPGDMKKLLRAEYFNPTFFAQSAYGRLILDMHPYRWLITTPTRMYYGEIDESLSIGLARLPMDWQKAMGNPKVEAISFGPNASHRITFGKAVPQWKAWFDSLQSN